ncbi:unnamed protein product [Rotaria sp. Silwood2]|nr:unnamed protein product [Rotaria sp. Silwood2]
MGKRGRPPKRKSAINTPSKVDQCYTILSSDDETGNKKETLRLPSPSQRRGVGNERNETIIITPPDRSKPSTNNVEKSTPVTRSNNNNNNNNNINKKKVTINHHTKDSEASGDTDATEVYSVSNGDDEDYTEEAPTISPIKRKRKPPVIKVNHDLSENSDDDLTYLRRSINTKQRKRQETSSSSSLSSDDSQSRKRARPPIPTFKRAQAKKKNKKNFDETSNDDDVLSDGDYNTDVEKMDDKALIKKTEQRMLHDEDLTVMTQKALQDERQRVQRIQERQSQLPPSSQILIDEDDDDDHFNLDDNVKKQDEKKEPKSLVFEYDSNTGKPLIWVLPELVAKMKPHQLDGTMFLWENVFESVAQIKKDNTGTGCILAHHMGLGKTFQLISFLHAVFKHSDISRTRTCLILCPVNVISNWAAEFSYWLSGVRPTIKVYQFSLFKTKSARWERLEKWNDKGGVMLMGYEIYRRLSNDADYNFFLSDPGPDIVVCDEGHVLKNAKAGISKALNKIRTKRRIILTGTPLQNNLREYYYMVHFVKPHLLGTYREFKNQFIDPIRAGQHKDSNIYAVQLMKRRAFALHERLQHCTHRRDFNVLRKYLPEKYEYVVKIYMCDLQKQLYNKYLKIQNIDPSTGFNTAKLFADYQYLMKIWTHPWLLRPHFIDRWKKQQKKNDDESDNIDPFFDDIFAGLSDDDAAAEDEPQKKQSIPNKRLATKPKTGESNHHRHKNDENDGNSSSNSSSSSTSEFLALFNNTNWKQYTSTSSSSSTALARTSTTPSTCSTNDPCQQAMNDEWWFSFFDNTAEYDISLSGKLSFLKTLLDECEQIEDKVLLFSRSLFSLSYLEQYLKYWDSIASGKKIQADDFDAKVKANGRWKFGIDYFRIDGSTDIATRTSYIAKFNDAANIRSRLFIVSTMAGGIGVNLIGSNRVVIFDCSWNPSSDLQALFRSYRLGQKKATYVYRLLSKGSMEEKIYFRQVNKQAMAQRVVDAQQLARHFTESELRELYAFKPEEDEPQEYKLHELPDDAILRNCVKKNHALVQNILEHDSLLENHIEEQLTREEKYYAIKELERDERQAEYQSAIAKTLANLAHNNNNNNNNTNLPQSHSETTLNDAKKDRKIITAPPLNTYNPYQPPPPMCAQARAGISTAQEARGLERLTELLFPKEALPLPCGKAADLPPLKELTDMPVSKDEIADINLDDEEFDPRTKKEKQKALLQEQRALVKLYNDKKKLLNPPKVPKVLKRPKKLPAVNTSLITNPYQFMPVTLNPFDMPPNMQKRSD